MLAGAYGGVAAGVTVGGGPDADALFGGSNRGIGLQPLSKSGFTGLNAKVARTIKKDSRAITREVTPRT